MRRGVALVMATAFWLVAPVAEARPDAPQPGELPPFFDEGDVVETHDAPGGLVRVHFTRAGRHVVDLSDGDDDGVPDVVELAGDTLVEAWVYYRDELGFREPLSDAAGDPNGGDGRFDLYLLRFDIGANGAFRRERCGPEGCFGYAVIEADFRRRRFPSVRDAHRIVGSHELFHAVQAAYAGDLSVNVSEGTATWATERFDARLDDFEGQIAGFMARPERALDQEPTGPIDGFSYGTGLLFGFLDARFPGNDFVQQLLQGSTEEAGWLPRLEVHLGDATGAAFADELAVFARWNLATGRRRAAEGYAQAATYPELEPRVVDLPYADEALRVFRASTRYFRAPLVAGAREDYQVALVGAEETLASLTLLGALEDATGGLRTFVAPDPARVLELRPAGNAVFAHAAVVNGASQGNSARPGLCFGTPAEVDACQSRMVHDATDMGMADGGPGDMGAGDAGAEPARASRGGCSAAGATASWPIFAWGLAASLVPRRRPRPGEHRDDQPNERRGRKLPE
ncbi:MAG: MXAN_6640 family putative metalloprotease, partial [Myxococcota bacterium]